MTEHQKIGELMAQARVEHLKAKRAVERIKSEHLDIIKKAEANVVAAFKKIEELDETLRIMVEEGLPFVQANMIAKDKKK